mgnify:CR=1
MNPGKRLRSRVPAKPDRVIEIMSWGLAKAQLAQKSKKARAVDDKTGQLLDLLQG